jgi:hypothetical protein
MGKGCSKAYSVCEQQEIFDVSGGVMADVIEMHKPIVSSAFGKPALKVMLYEDDALVADIEDQALWLLVSALITAYQTGHIDLNAPVIHLPNSAVISKNVF